jgi:hypothetical protein
MSNIYQKLGAVLVSLVGIYLVALALIALTLLSIQHYEQTQIERNAKSRCLVWRTTP